jgi:membrane fusion protein, multidrug efflux system
MSKHFRIPYSNFPEMLKSVLLALGVFFILGLMASCSEKKTDASKVKRERTVPVMVSTVTEKTIPLQLTAIGNVETYSTVSVKSRVSGELVGVHFREGQDVNQGDLLFTIDPVPFETDLKKAQANLAQQVALAQKAELDLKRYSELIQKDYISRDQYDQANTNLESLKAQIKADQAAVETARLQVGYCFIRAPFPGRTGALLVNKGNLIKVIDDKPLVVINQILPIYISFSLPEQNLAELKKYSTAGKLRIKAFISNEEEHPEEGLLTFIDNTVDQSTGTFRVKGTFPNKERRLWPGQFVNVVLALSSQPHTIVVPSQAVQTGLDGSYVFVVKPDQKVEHRPVVVGRNLDGETTIQKGLQAGEVVVTDGQFQLVPGTKVQVKKGLEGKGAGRS